MQRGRGAGGRAQELPERKRRKATLLLVPTHCDRPRQRLCQAVAERMSPPGPGRLHACRDAACASRPPLPCLSSAADDGCLNPRTRMKHLTRTQGRHPLLLNHAHTRSSQPKYS